MSPRKVAGSSYSRADDDNLACTYCGVSPADTWDHFYPLSAAATLSDLGIKQKAHLKVLVRACTECNAIAGAKQFKTIALKRRYIIGRLERRYGKYLRIPDWTKAELSEMEPRQQDEIRNAIKIRDAMRLRCAA